MTILFFMHDSWGGGTTTYTLHLHAGMLAAGLQPRIVRPRPRGESHSRVIGKTGVPYWNVDAGEALRLARKHPSLIVASADPKILAFAPDLVDRLLAAGTRVVLHDPTEFNNFGGPPPDPICVRPAGKRASGGGVFVPHPYVRVFDRWEYESDEREWTGVSVARVTFRKRTHLICEANRALRKSEQIQIRGSENRLYTRHVLGPKYGFVQGTTGFDVVMGEGARLCARARYHVDFTKFPDDGGGTQYTILEAWDAGAVNVVHSDWLEQKGELEHGANCIGVEGPDELVRLVRSDKRHGEIVNQGYAMLKRHDAVRVARMVQREISR